MHRRRPPSPRALLSLAALLAVLGPAGLVGWGPAPARAAGGGPAWRQGPLSPTVEALGAPSLGSPPASGAYVAGVAAAPSGRGYYVLRADGEVDAYGVPSYGSVPVRLPVGVTATGIAVDPATGGYWVLGSMGQVWAFHAPYLGRVRVPGGGWGQYPATVAIAAAPAGRGYYVLRANGAVAHFGAPFYGDVSHRLHYGATAPVVATSLAVDPATGGYWVLTSDGGLYSFHAPFRGAPGPGRAQPTALVGLPGGGYLVARADGSVETFTTGARPVGVAPALPLGAALTGAARDPATGGFWLALDHTFVGGYLNPLRSVVSLVPQEVDQGVDYCGSGPVYAIGPGVVLNTLNPQWPGGAFISYRLLAGPAAGEVVYVAEDVAPAVRVGEGVGPSSVLGYVRDAGTCMETGWANAADPGEQAAGHFEYDGRNSTAYGLNFDQLLEALGARPGLVQPDGPPGPLPRWWPRW